MWIPLWTIVDSASDMVRPVSSAAMDAPPLEAVVFDMDGTLVDSDAAVERSWRAWAAEYRVDPGGGPLVAHGLPALGNVRRLRPDLSEDEAAAAAPVSPTRFAMRSIRPWRRPVMRRAGAKEFGPPVRTGRSR